MESSIGVRQKRIKYFNEMKREIFFIITLGMVFSIAMSIFTPGKGAGDFLGYWSATNLFLTGGNPYDQAEVTSLQNSVSPIRGSNNNAVITSWNPPWLILTLLPIGLLPYSIAVPAWIVANTLLIGLSLLISWNLCAGYNRSRAILFLFVAGFLFAETISYLGSGQITGLVVLSIVMTIWFLKNDYDILAGITLLLATSKPHISYFFFLLVIIWLLKNHRWKIIVGFGLTALISMLIFWIFIPSWFNDYAYLIKHLPFTLLYTSTLGSFISAKVGFSLFKYSAVILLFLINPLIRLVTKEGWLTTANLALMISVPLSPFGFNFDQIILLPAIAQIIYWLSNKILSIKTKLILATSLLTINFIALKMITLNGLEQFWFFWIPFAILIIYVYSWKANDGSQ